jgi:alpha-L-rhamnosidase
LYEADINGRRIGDAYLTPGWTSYKTRLQYQAYDVTPLLKDGVNAVGVTLGSGWYRGTIGYTNSKNVYGKDIALLFQLNIVYNDGSTDLVWSNDTWKSSIGSIRSSEIYNGETIDARLDKMGFSFPGYNDADWSGVKLADFSFDNLIATYNEPCRKARDFSACENFHNCKRRARDRLRAKSSGLGRA